MAVKNHQAFYDDPNFDYHQYWQERDYEQKAEEIALKRLFRLIPKKESLLDVGGGFGRLVPTYAPIFKNCFLLDPSKRMLQETKKLLKQYPNLKPKRGVAEKLPYPDKSIQTILCVRTIHHLNSPEKGIREFARVLKPKGFLILEFANKMHFKNILKAIFRFDLGFFSSKPEDISLKEGVTPFLNYHPQFIKKLLARQGFKIRKTYSVSNFRHPLTKKLIPLSVLLAIESGFSLLTSCFPPFSFFGPSIFVFCQKA